MHDKTGEPSNLLGEIVGDAETLDRTRREALLQIGKYAAYTAPALLVMWTSKAVAQADSLIPR